MKKGFTMIELIFVIVILGILAAVAIPRLAATRDDAKVAKAAQEVSTAVSDITAYYTANGKFANNTDMTNVSFGTSDANLSTGFSYQLPDGTDCILFKSTAGYKDGNFTVSPVTTGATNEPNCASLQTALSASDVNRTYTVGGRRVTY